MTAEQNANLYKLIEQTASKPVIAEIEAMANAIRVRHELSVLAILGYGSCLRGELVKDTLVDFYLLVDDYKNAHKNKALSIGNQLLPPNVYYQECSYNNQLIRCKYAVVTLEQFEDKVSLNTSNPYFWARFAQPSALIYARDEATRHRVIEALVTATKTTQTHAQMLENHSLTTQERWTGIFSQTYLTELRSERSNRASQLVETNLKYFIAIDAASQPSKGTIPAQSWRTRRLVGKTLSVLRLIKAAFTFDGGADYLAWKITRHSGVEITLTPWQRRHPILSAPKLFWELYNKGAFQ